MSLLSKYTPEYLAESVIGSFCPIEVNWVLLREPKIITTHLEILGDGLLDENQLLILYKSGCSNDSVRFPDLRIEVSSENKAILLLF